MFDKVPVKGECAALFGYLMIEQHLWGLSNAISGKPDCRMPRWLLMEGRLVTLGRLELGFK